MAIMPKLKVIAFPIPIPMPLWAAILIGFVFMLVPGVAWQAHLGGLIAGLIFGWLYRKKARIPTFY
jgi:membrane associated rhomboid family serine protease